MTSPSRLPSDDVVSPVGRHPLATRDEAEAIELRAEVNRRFAQRGWPLVADVESTDVGELEIVIRDLQGPRETVHCVAEIPPASPAPAPPPAGDVAPTIRELNAGPSATSRTPIMTSCGMEPVRPGWCDPV